MTIEYHIPLTKTVVGDLEIEANSYQFNNEEKKKKVTLFQCVGSDQWYLKNPYWELPEGVSYHQFDTTAERFKKLMEEGYLKVEEEDFDETAKAIGLGDMFWISGSTFAALNPTVNLAGNGFFPLIVGPLVGLMAYRFQVREYEKRTGDSSPSDAQKAIFRKNAIALTFKVMFAMAGWEIGLYATKWVANTVFAALHFVPHTALGIFIFHAVVGLGIGLCQGIFLVATSMMTERAQHGKLTSSHADRFKLFLAGFTAGIAWYGATFIPFAGPLSKLIHTQLPSVANTAIDAVGRGVVTFLAVTGIFASLHPKQVAISFVTGVRRLLFKAQEDDGRNKLPEQQVPNHSS